MFTTTVLFTLLIAMSASLCPPTIQTYCLEGREGFNSAINGEYVYEGCHSDMPYFRNQNRNTDHLFLFFHDSDTILIGPDYTTSSASAACDQSSLQNCNQNWKVYDGSAWPEAVDSSIYFGSDCDYAHDTPSLCTELTQVSITVAFDSESLSDTYQVAGCYDSEPHLSNDDLFIYFNYDSSIYYISDTFGDTTNAKATCDLSIYKSITHCFFVPSGIEHSVSLDFQLSDNVNSFQYMLYIGLPLSFIYFIIIIAVMISSRKALKQKVSNKSTEAQITNNIEMTQRSEIKQNATQNEEDTAPKKCTVKYIGKCVFVFLIKPALEIYDYYTDFGIALIWMDYRLLDHNKCPVYYDKYAYPLLISSSLGFVIGVIGYIYRISQEYFLNKRLSYHSLSDLKQSTVNYFVWAKMFLEDIVAIILFLIVSENEIGITDTEWWLAYYSSCVGLMLSAILLIRKIMPTVRGAIGFRKKIMIVLLVGAPSGLPLYPSGKTEFRSKLRLGFALNENECQIFANNDGTYVTFDAEDNALYSIYCGAIFDRSRTNFLYDEGEYSGLYCSLYQPSSEEEVACKFSMLEGECWNGRCDPYHSNITACFGYIGLQ